MPQAYGSEKVKCPFYKEETKNSIKCEGVISINCTQTFEDAHKKISFKSKYCEKDYFNCEHFIQVEKKYPL